MQNSQTNKRLLNPQDMWKMEFISTPALSADGSKAVFVKYTADKESGEFYSRIYEVSSLGGEAVEIPHIQGNKQTRPAFSPDGNKLAFLSDGSVENQIWILDLRNGDKPKKLTSLRHGVIEFIWSPDGKKLAFTTPLWPDELAELFQAEMSEADRQEKLWQQENIPVVVEKLMYKFDETFGIEDGSCRQIGMLDLESNEVQILTRDEFHHESPAWSPDGSKLAFYAYPYGHHKAMRKECFVHDLQNGEACQLTEDSPYFGPDPVVFSSDGKSLYFCDLKEEDKASFLVKLFRFSLEDGSKTCVFPENNEICHGMDQNGMGKSVYGVKNPAFQLSKDGEFVYFLSGWDGCSHIYHLDLTKSKLTQVTRGKISISSFCTPQNGKLLYTRAEDGRMDELYLLDLKSGEEKRLSFSNKWMEEVLLPEPLEMWVDSTDGKCRIHGHVLPPAGLQEGESCPAVLNIHGGPVVFYTNGFNFEFYMLSATRMAVITCDPRGSTGYGHEFAKDEYSWGEEAYADLMAFTDAALEKFGYIDGERLGVTGGSYGGYMTNRIIGTTDRFKAAVTQRTFSNQATSYGTGDMGFISSSDQKPPSFADYMFKRAKRSTITKIDNMNTPLLLLHGEKDYRCSMEQSEQLFIALKDRKPDVPVRMVIFPGENHNVSRTGNMYHQISHVSEMTEWFKQYLAQKEEGQND